MWLCVWMEAASKGRTARPPRWLPRPPLPRGARRPPRPPRPQRAVARPPRVRRGPAMPRACAGSTASPPSRPPTVPPARNELRERATSMARRKRADVLPLLLLTECESLHEALTALSRLAIPASHDVEPLLRHVIQCVAQSLLVILALLRGLQPQHVTTDLLVPQLSALMPEQGLQRPPKS